jgi:hypothetical protein
LVVRVEPQRAQRAAEVFEGLCFGLKLGLSFILQTAKAQSSFDWRIFCSNQFLSMSKCTLLEVDSDALLGRMVAFLEADGFDFGNLERRILLVEGVRYLDITQRQDDTGNGLGDATLYRARLDLIDRQSARKRANGWSPSKVEKWIVQKRMAEIEPLLSGAEIWLARFRRMFEVCGILRLGVVVAINEVHLGEGGFEGVDRLSLQNMNAEQLLTIPLAMSIEIVAGLRYN